MFNIKDVIVDKISLITKGKRPAVEKAETKFSIFKMAKVINKEQNTKLDKIIKGYDETLKDIENKD